MACQVYRKNASLYVLFDEGQEYLFNQSSVRFFISDSQILYISYNGIADAVRLGQYNNIKNVWGDFFSSQAELIDYLSREIFLTEGDVYLQDQLTNVIDYYIPIPKEVLALGAIPVIGSYEITLVDATSVIVGDYIVIKKETRAYQAQVLSITGNVLTMDTPLDYAFSLDSIIESRTLDFNVDGSITPVVAELKPPPGVCIDINIITISMTDTVAMDDAKFGGRAALTRGLVVRQARNGSGYITLFNAKNNGQLAHRMRLEYSDRAPTGVYGLRASKFINGQEGNGVVIRLDGNEGESLQVVIQDNLSGLASFSMTARGHVVRR